MIPPISPAVPHAPREAAQGPLRAAASDLHRQFVAEMLKHAKLGEALGGEDGGADLGGALASVALDRIAADVAASQTALTDGLYKALRRAAPTAT